MTIEIWYDRDARCFVGHEATRDVYSAGTTWQRAILATADAVSMWDRYCDRVGLSRFCIVESNSP